MGDESWLGKGAGGVPERKNCGWRCVVGQDSALGGKIFWMVDDKGMIIFWSVPAKYGLSL